MVKSLYVTGLFGLPALSPEIEQLFLSLNTLNRPSIPEDEEFVYHDWVLVRRKGLELGFADSEYHSAAPRHRWGLGELLLTQAYFYSGFNDIQSFTGELPYGLDFNDCSDVARQKLAVFESTRHSYRNDTWDVDGYRLSVTYTENRNRIDRIACRQLATPIPRQATVVWPELSALIAVLGCRINDPAFLSLWGNALDTETIQVALEDDEIDFTQTFGATVSLVGGMFRSITLHRNRDTESAGWAGELPLGLSFEGSPEMLFSKLNARPIQQSDSALTGHAVWHFPDYTLHVLYSNLDNRLLRIKLIAPGVWKCVEEC